MNLNDIFTNRELAAGSIIILTFGFSIYRIIVDNSVRKSAITAFSLTLKPPFLIIFFSYLLFYFFLATSLLNKYGEEPEYIEHAFIIAVFVGFPILFKTLKTNFELIKVILLSAFGLLALCTFYFNAASFNLPIEIILQLLFWFGVLCSKSIDMTQSAEYLNVAKFGIVLRNIIFLIYLIHAIVFVTNEIQKSSFGDLLRLESFDVILTLLLLPFMFLFFIYSAYQSLFITFPYLRTKEAKMSTKTKLGIVIELSLSLYKINNLKMYWRGRVADATNFQEARMLVKEYKKTLIES